MSNTHNTVKPEQPLVEWGELIDPLDSLRNESDFFGGRFYGRRDRPDAKRNGDNWPHFSNESELEYLRGHGRYIAETDPTGINIVETLASYVVGVGMNHQANPGPEAGAEGEEAAFQAQRVIDEFLEREAWIGTHDVESFRRVRKYGERFNHVVDAGNGFASVEVVEPSWVTEPANGDALAYYYGDESLHGLDWKYGVATPVNRPREVRAYYVVRYGDPKDAQVVPVGRMSHVKANVDTGVKRGLTDFYGGAETWINDSQKTLRNVVKGAGVQAAIALIRKHQTGASAASINSAADAQVEFNTQISRSAENGGTRSIPTERYYPGKVMDIRGYDAMYGPMGTPAGPNFIPPVEAGLRYAGRRWGLPEDMMSGNASGTNFASILESHTPFTISQKRAQVGESQEMVVLLWMVLDIACQAGRIPYRTGELRTLIKVVVSPPDIETRDLQAEHAIRREQHERGLLSLQTWSDEAGLDYEREQENIAKEPAPRPVAPASPVGFAMPTPAGDSYSEQRVERLRQALVEGDEQQD